MSFTGKSLRSQYVWTIRQQPCKPLLDVLLTSAIYSFAPRIRYSRSFLRLSLYFEVTWLRTPQLTHTVQIVRSGILGSVLQEQQGIFEFSFLFLFYPPF